MKKLLAIVLTVFTFALAGVFYGCGDPYKKAKISVLTGNSITLSIDENGETEPVDVKVKVSGMPKKTSKEAFPIIDKDNAEIVENSKQFNEGSGETTFKVVAKKGGSCVLTIKASGGKTATVEILVQERLQGFSFASDYKPVIVKGQNFSVNKNVLKFDKPSATNTNVTYSLINKQTQVPVDEFVGNVLSSEITTSLATSENTSYALHAVTEDGNFSDQKDVIVVEEINENDIKLIENNENLNVINEISLAVNGTNNLNKNLIVSVPGKNNIAVSVDASRSNGHFGINHTNNSTGFTIFKQSVGVGYLTINVGYADTLDSYKVSKTYTVEVYEEPLEIKVDNLKQNNVLNVFAINNGMRNEFERFNVSVIPSTTSFKNVKLQIEEYNLNKFKFAKYINGNYEELNFQNDENGNRVAEFSVNDRIFVARQNAIEGESVDVKLISARNSSVFTNITLEAHANVTDFQIKNRGSDIVDFNDDNGEVETIFVPYGATRTFNFGYTSGYSDLVFDHNANITTKIIEQNVNNGGTFSVEGKVFGETYLNIYNGNVLQRALRVVVANAAANDVLLYIVANDNNNNYILTQNYIDDQNGHYLETLYFNANGVNITTNLSNNSSATILHKNVAGSNSQIIYNNNTGNLIVENVRQECSTTLTFTMFYYKSVEGDNYQLVKVDRDVHVYFTPKPAADMINFVRTGTTNAITNVNLFDYTTVSYNDALTSSILDLGFIVTNEHFSVGEVTAQTTSNVLTIKKISNSQFLIVAGSQTNNIGVQRAEVKFTFSQQGTNQTVDKILTIIVEKRDVIENFVLAEDAPNLLQNDDGNFILRLDEDGQTQQLVVKQNAQTNTNLPFSLIDAQIDVANGVEPISISATGVVTRINEGTATLTLSLKNNSRLNFDVWKETGRLEAINNPNGKIYTVDVRCSGANTPYPIVSNSDLYKLAENKYYILENNLDLTNFNFTLNEFSGRLNGNNKVLYGLNLNSPLFNINLGTIQNLQILDFNYNINFVKDETFGVICRTNLGTIDNISVCGNATLSSNNNVVNFGGVAGENGSSTSRVGSINNAKIDVKVNVIGNAQFKVGGIVGVNYSTITSNLQYYSNTTETPLIVLKVNGVDDNILANIGGVVGVNKGYSISGVKAEAVVNVKTGGTTASNTVAGGVVGENNSSFSQIGSVSGSLITNGKIYSAGGILGSIKQIRSIANSYAVIKNLDNAFSATNAGGVAGTVYSGVDISDVNIIGTSESGDVKIFGDNVGGIFGSAAQVNADRITVTNLALDGTNKGNFVGKIAETTQLGGANSTNVDDYIFVAHFANGEQIVEVTSTPNGNPINGVFAIINGQLTQLYKTNIPVDTEDDIIVYRDGEMIYTGYTNTFVPNASTFNNITLNNVDGATGEFGKNANLALNRRVNQNNLRLCSGVMPLADSDEEQDDEQGEIIENAITFNADVGKTSFISALNDNNDFAAEILPYSKTQFNEQEYDNNQILNVAVSEIDSSNPVLIELDKLINYSNLNLFSIKLYNNGIYNAVQQPDGSFEVGDLVTTEAQLYLNSLIVKQQGVIALQFTPYANVNAEKQYLFIRIAKIPNPQLLTSAGEVVSSPIYISGNEITFDIKGKTDNTQISSDVGDVTLENNKLTVKFVEGSKGGHIFLNDSIVFDNLIFVNGTDSYFLANYAYNQGDFNKDIEIIISSKIKNITSTISEAYITKNEQAYVTTYLTVNGSVKEDEVKELYNFGISTEQNNALTLEYELVDRDIRPNGNETIITLVHRVWVNAADLETTISGKILYKISVSENSEKSDNKQEKITNELYLTIEPQKIDSVEEIMVNPLANISGNEETEADVFVVGEVAKITVKPHRIFNDESEIKVSFDLDPKTNFNATNFNACLSLNPNNDFNAGELTVTKDKVDNQFVFYIRIDSKLSSDKDKLKDVLAKLVIKYNNNKNEYKKSFNLVTKPDINLDYNNPYYAIGTEKEIILTDSNGNQLLYNESVKEQLAGFKVTTVLDNGETQEITLPTVNGDRVDINDDFSIRLYNERYYIKGNKSTKIGSTFTLHLFGKIKLNGNDIPLEISQTTITAVKFTVDSITFSTPSGKQQRDKEIPIDFNINLTYDTSNEQIESAATKWISEARGNILNYWNATSETKYAELFYNGYNSKNEENKTSVNMVRPETNFVYYKDGKAQFILVPKYNGTNLVGYAIWGVNLNVENIITVRTLIFYNKEGVPKLQQYTQENANNENYHELESNFKFSFYQLSTEENPTAIYTADEFKTILSEEKTNNNDTTDGDANLETEHHYRLMNNIFLSDYTPIAANFDSLDGNGYVVYIESFANSSNSETDEENSISLGLFSEIKENTIVKNLSIAISDLSITGVRTSTSANANKEINLTNYSQVEFGLLTPINRGYIVNCEVVSFDLSKTDATPSTADENKKDNTTDINLKTAYNADVVVGGLVAHNYGSVVNSRVGRSLNSDYEYLGYGLVGGEPNYEDLVGENRKSGDVNEGADATTANTNYSKLVDKNALTQNGVNITAAGTLGGLVGYNHEGAIISSSYFAGGSLRNTTSVVENSFTGGLAAFNDGTILLSAVEGNFSEYQKQLYDNAKNKVETIIENRDLFIVRQGSQISSQGNIGGLVYKNNGEISDSYANIKISTNARSAAFVYNTENGTVKNSYAFSTSEATTNNAPFVGIEPFETSYKGNIETSYYYKPNDATNYKNVTAEDRKDNTNLITQIPDSTFASLSTTYMSFAFSSLATSGTSLNNGVWEMTNLGPIISSAHSIAISSYQLKAEYLNELKDNRYINFDEDDDFDISKIEGYIARPTGLTNYVLIKNAKEFNDRILNGEAAYHSAIVNKENPSKNVYRLISNISFGTDNDRTTIATSNLQFEGILDGNGLNINNLVITDTTTGDNNSNKPSGVPEINTSLATGMFAALANQGCIKNLNVYVGQVALSNTTVVGALVGIMENSYVYNVNILPNSATSQQNNVSGSKVAAGAIGMVIGDATKFKIANVTSSVNVAAVNIALPASGSTNEAVNSASKAADSVYQGWKSGTTVNKNVSLSELKKDNYTYVGTSVAAGVVGVISVSVPDDVTVDIADPSDNNDNTKSITFKNLISNGTNSNNVSYAQISRVKAYGNNLRLTGVNVGGVVGFVDEYVYVHDAEFETTAYTQGASTAQNLGGTLTAGGIAAVNKGLIKYGRIVHANQLELDEIYLSKNQTYNYTQNSIQNLFNLTPVKVSKYNTYVGGIAAINHTGEIADSFVKVDITPKVVGSNSPYYLGFAAGLSVGGRIDYFYSLANIDASKTSGLIGFAALNNNATGNGTNNNVSEKDEEFVLKLTKLDTKTFNQAIINNASVIVPITELPKDNNLGALAGQMDSNVFGTQTKPTIINFKYTNATNINVPDNLYMYKIVIKNTNNDTNNNTIRTTLLEGKEFEALLRNQAGDSFSNFAATLRWNVYSDSKYRMPFPFYGISDSIKNIKKESDFRLLSEFPDAVFVIHKGTYTLDADMLSGLGQFNGILMAREDVVINIEDPQKPIFDTISGATIYGFNINVTGGNIKGGVLGRVATNSQISDINITLSENVSAKLSDNNNFGVLVGSANNCVINNVNVNYGEANCTISASTTSGTFGSLVGKINNTTITSCSATNLAYKFQDNSDVVFGGLIGNANESTISNSYAQSVSVSETVKIKLNGTFGGFVGKIESSIITNCYAAGGELGVKMTADNNVVLKNVGGFVGLNDNTTISYCFADVQIVGDNVGGFVGENKGTINNCYAMGTLQGEKVGGFAYTSNGTIENCYTTSDINPNSNSIVGGFIVSATSGTISNCYSLSKIEHNNSIETAGQVKNFAHTINNNITVKKCFYASELNYKYNLLNTGNTYKINDDFLVGNDASGEHDGVKAKSISDFFNRNVDLTGFGYTTAESGYQYTYLLNYASNQLGNKFNEYQQNNPKLKAKTISSSENVTLDEINLIKSNITLNSKFISADLENKIIIGATLDNNATHFTINGNTSVFGSVTNSIITNIHINVSENNVETASLLASEVSSSILNKIAITGGKFTANNATANGTIAQTLTDNSLLINSRNEAEILGKKSYVGGLVGTLSDSTIIACYNGANIQGTSNLGGLVANVSGTSRIERSYNIGKVFGSYTEGTNIGGLVSSSDQCDLLVLTDCYNTGLLVGKNTIGGLISSGENTNIYSSYNTGAINASEKTTIFPVANGISISGVYYNSDLFPHVDVENVINRKTTSELLVAVATNLFVFSDFEVNKTNQFPLLNKVGGFTDLESGGQTPGRGANLIKLTAEDLNAQLDRFPNYNYILNGNIDLNEINAITTEFTGSLYGQNYTFYNAQFPVFGNATNATICNVNVMGSGIADPNNPNNNGGNFNAAVANKFSGGFISLVKFTGDINAVVGDEGAFAGGIVAQANNSTIANCNAIEVDVYQYLTAPSDDATENYYLGGIVGKSDNSNILNSTYSGNIYIGRSFNDEGSVGFGNAAKFYIGGIAGYASGGNFSSNSIQHQVFYGKGNDTAVNGKSEIVNEELSPDNCNISNGPTINLKDEINGTATIATGDNATNNQSVKLRSGSSDFSSIHNTDSIKADINAWMTKLNSDKDKNNNAIIKAGSSYRTPMLISSFNDFKAIVNDKYYKIVCNIDEKDGSLDGSIKAPKYLDGRGYVVGGFTVNANSIFGDFNSKTIFKNVVFDDIVVNATASGTVTRNSDGNITADNSTSNSAIITQNNSGKIKYVGIVGCVLNVKNEDGDEDEAGETDVSSYSVGTVGGIAANNGGTIAYCYSLAEISVSGAYNGTVGGLVGINDQGQQKGGLIKNSYNSGIIALPSDSQTGNNNFTTSGTVTQRVLLPHNTAVGKVSNVFGISEIHNSIRKNIPQDPSGYSIHAKDLANAINFFTNFQNARQYSDNNGLISSQNAGLPNYLLHKNFKSYNQFAFNWIGERTEHSTGTAINDWTGFNGIGENGTYYLTSNIYCNGSLNELIQDTFSGTIYFNGYSIFGLNINATNQQYVGLFGTLKAAKIYNASIINPQVKAKIDENCDWFESDDINRPAENLYVGIIASCAESITRNKLSHVTIMTPDGPKTTTIVERVVDPVDINFSAILGGYQNIECADRISNNVTSGLSSPDVVLGDIYVDGAVAKSQDNININNAFYSTSIYVKTASAKSLSIETSDLTVSLNASNEITSNYINFNQNGQHVGRDIISGSVILSDLYINLHQSEGEELLYIESGYGLSGSVTIGKMKTADKHTFAGGHLTRGIDNKLKFKPGTAQSGNISLSIVTVGKYDKIKIISNGTSVIGNVENNHELTLSHELNDHGYVHYEDTTCELVPESGDYKYAKLGGFVGDNNEITENTNSNFILKLQEKSEID